MEYNIISIPLPDIDKIRDLYCSQVEFWYEEDFLNKGFSIHKHMAKKRKMEIKEKSENLVDESLKIMKDLIVNKIETVFVKNDNYVDNDIIAKGSIIDKKLNGIVEIKYKYGFYKGYAKDNLRDGRGDLDIYKHGHYEGEFKDDMFHGGGKRYYENGSIYTGSWYESKKTGHGEYFDFRGNYTYIGDFFKDNKHGTGKLMHEDIIYEGEWKNNGPIGKFKVKYYNGTYEGEIENYLPNGYGKFTISNQEYYEGIFHKGKYLKGKYVTEKFTYEGEFNNNLFHGTGILKDHENFTYEGLFEDGIANGPCKLQWLSKKIKDVLYKGTNHNFVYNGYGELYFPDGMVIKADFLEGEINGKHEEFYANGDSMKCIRDHDKITKDPCFFKINNIEYKTMYDDEKKYYVIENDDRVIIREKHKIYLKEK